MTNYSHPTLAFSWRRAISIQAEGTSLLEKHACHATTSEAY